MERLLMNGCRGVKSGETESRSFCMSSQEDLSRLNRMPSHLSFHAQLEILNSRLCMKSEVPGNMTLTAGLQAYYQAFSQSQFPCSRQSRS